MWDVTTTEALVRSNSHEIAFEEDGTKKLHILVLITKVYFPHLVLSLTPKFWTNI